MFYEEPIFFEKNRVRRVYTGGKLFSDFFGDNSEDGFFPEEWIASAVHALNEGSTDPNEGISVINGNGLLLSEALEKYKSEILGNKAELGILAKFIDSSIRLPVQAHPDKAFSKKYLNSSHGKEECWLILGTRPGAKVFYGFKSGVSAEDFIAAVDASEKGGNDMEKLLKTIDVLPGDVIYIPSKFVHAIGSGCLLLEIQEPTDFTIQPERFCGDYRLSDNEMYLGLSRSKALECFDLNKSYNAPLILKTISHTDSCLYQIAVDEHITTSFNINIVNLFDGEFEFKIGAAVYVILEGNGIIQGNNYHRAVKRGDYFLLPYCAENKYIISGTLKMAESYNKGDRL